MLLYRKILFNNMTNEQVPDNATNILILLTKVEDPLQFCKIRIKSTKTKSA